MQVADYGRARTLRQVMGLLEGDPILTRIFVENLDWRILAPLGLSQCRLIWNDHRLAGFVTWANLDPALARALDEDDELRIEPEDWRGGDEPWIVDAVILPGSEPALAAMFATLFPEGVQQFRLGVNARITTAAAGPA